MGNVEGVMKEKINKLANRILETEKIYNRWLLNGYNNESDFINDVIEEIEKNGVDELVQYYSFVSKNCESCRYENVYSYLMSTIELLKSVEKI